MGKDTNVYLASAELSAVCAILGKLPTPAEYAEYARKIDAGAADSYRYMNFHQMADYTAKADKVIFQTSDL